jgi:hypothetical protein
MGLRVFLEYTIGVSPSPRTHACEVCLFVCLLVCFVCKVSVSRFIVGKTTLLLLSSYFPRLPSERKRGLILASRSGVFSCSGTFFLSRFYHHGWEERDTTPYRATTLCFFLFIA